MKNLITWSEGYSVGNQEIDIQHKKLIDLINRLYNLYLTKQQNGVNDILKEIKVIDINCLIPGLCM